MPEKESPHSIHHRGCGIKPASYPVGPQAWLPEACVWLQTEGGLRRIWVHSFAHCFDAEKLTFASKLAADGWALDAARMIIDRALEQWKAAASLESSRHGQPAAGRWRMARQAIMSFRLFRMKPSAPAKSRTP